MVPKCFLLARPRRLQMIPTCAGRFEQIDVHSLDMNETILLAVCRNRTMPNYAAIY